MAISTTVSPPVVTNRLDTALGHRLGGLICYAPLGDPAVPDDLPVQLVDAGVDVLEIGIPAPNPYLDGGVVRDSMARARGAGASLARIAERTRELRLAYPDQAMVWMAYAATLDEDELVALATYAGIDGVIVPESARYFDRLRNRLATVGVHLIAFVARDAVHTDARHASLGSGYVMLQARGGSTGGGGADVPLPESRAHIAHLRAAGVTAPVALGIGISTPPQARQARKMGADAVIVGSAIIEAAKEGSRALRPLLTGLRAATL